MKVTMIKMPVSGHSYARLIMPLKAVGRGVTLFSVAPGASNRARDSASSTRLADAPRNSRDSSGLIGVALADEGEDKVLSPRQQHIISPEKLADPSSDSPPVSDVSLTRRALILIPYFYNRP